MNSMIITRDGASFFINGTPYTIGTDHPNYNAIIDAARNSEWDKIHDLSNIQRAVNVAIQKTNVEGLYIENGKVVYKHIVFPEDLGDYVINLVRDFSDLSPIVKFMDKLLKNPDHRVFQQLFGFLAYGKNPLTPDGNFLAYKKVNADFTSVADKKFKNDVGSTVSMPREACNNNPQETCSTGLHFCSKEYLRNFSGEKVVILEIDPTHVVSIPVDYNNTKGRACQYKIIGELSDVEIKEVMSDRDVLKVATVELKYQNTAPTIVGNKVEVTKPLDDGEISDADRTMYHLGYRDGRKKLTIANSGHVFYTLGYKHGRSKKKKIYTDGNGQETITPVAVEEAVVETTAPTKGNQPSDADRAMYQLGYRDGRKKLGMASRNDFYMEGYKHGRTKKKKIYQQ